MLNLTGTSYEQSNEDSTIQKNRQEGYLMIIEG